MPSHQQYGARIRRETALFANWPPNAPRQIGDFGPLNGAVFQLFGQLGPQEIASLGTRNSVAAAGYDMMLESSRTRKASLDGEADAPVATGKVLLEIGFASEQSIVFVAPSISITEITDMAALGRILTARRDKGNWIMDHTVIVQVMTAASATILLSTKADAKMGFEIGADVPIDAQLVAKLDASASLLSSDGVGMKIVGEGPLTPLFKLASLKRRLVGDPRIVYREAASPNADDAYQVHDVDEANVLVVR